MREYIYSIMTDKRDGAIASIMKGLLSLISFFYGLAIKIIRPMRTAAARRLPCKVISVGNLTLGGTGKTPTACMLAKFLKKEKRRPALLIRGYGDDEWRMLKNELVDIPVIVDKERYRSGMKASLEFNADTLILDDGFQHWAVKRDLNILLIDSTNPFGNGRLFPRGVLREDIKELNRADIIIFTKTDMGKERGSCAAEEIRRKLPNAVMLESVHSPSGLYDLKDKSYSDISFLKGKDICALSSIVNTDYFEFTLSRLGANIVARFYYPDHYNYKAKDLELIFDECGKRNIETIVTTEKDAVKLSAVSCQPTAGSETRIKVLQIELRITNGEGILHERLRGLYRG